jgi:hypothetical protein
MSVAFADIGQGGVWERRAGIHEVYERTHDAKSAWYRPRQRGLRSAAAAGADRNARQRDQNDQTGRENLDGSTGNASMSTWPGGRRPSYQKIPA